MEIIHGEGRCVSGVYDRRLYFFKMLKLLRRDLTLTNLVSLTQDLTDTIRSFFHSTSHCFEDTQKIDCCAHAQFHLGFIRELEMLVEEMEVECDDTEGFRFFVYKSLVRYLLEANITREEIRL